MANLPAFAMFESDPRCFGNLEASVRSAARRERSMGSDLADLIEAGLNEGAGEFATGMGIVARGALVGGGCDGRGPAGWPRVASMGSLSGRRVRPER